MVSRLHVSNAKPTASPREDEKRSSGEESLCRYGISQLWRLQASAEEQPEGKRSDFYSFPGRRLCPRLLLSGVVRPASLAMLGAARP